MLPRKINCLIGLMLVSTWLGALPVLATDFTYTGPDGGNWSASGNWSPGSGPPNSSGATAWINNDPSSVNVFLNTSHNVNQLKVDAGDSLTISNGRALTLMGTGAGITNNGTILLNAAGSQTWLNVSGSVAATLNGTGSITLGGDAVNNYLSGNPATASSTTAPSRAAATSIICPSSTTVRSSPTTRPCGSTTAARR